MATYSTNLALTLMATGEQSNTWGDTTNTNLGTLLEQAISGYVTQAITDGSSANTTITIPNGTTGVARNMFIEMTGALTFSTTSLIVPANKKLYFVHNNTTGGFAVTVKVTGQTGVSVPNGKKVVLVSNGTDIVSAENYIASLSVGALTSGRVPYAGTSGLLQDAANLTFNGTTLTANTIGAFTLSGTVAGGGNQLNNVIIGTTTPLAGAFTSLSSTIGANFATSSGNVGIGTSLPSTKLNVVSAINGGIAVTDGTVNTIIYSSTGGVSSIGTTTNHQVQLYSNNAARVTIDTSGNVGIGTITPSSFNGNSCKLAVNGSLVGLANTNAVSQYIWLASHFSGVASGLYTDSDAFPMLGSTTAHPYKFMTNATERMRIDSTGNVGIGTASPTHPLTVQKSNAADWVAKFSNASATGISGFGYYDNSDTWKGYVGYDNGAANFLKLFGTTSVGIILLTNNAEAMRITSAGLVGIGTTAPAYKLEVKGASATAGQLSIHDGTGDTTVSGVTAASLLFQARDTSIRTLAEIDAVNTTTNGTGGAMVFQTRVSDTLAERARIDSSGNVLVTNVAGLGYGTGAGGTVTQATDKSTAVTLNKPCGTITMNGAALAGSTTVTFTLNNSILAAADTITVNLNSSVANFVNYTIQASAWAAGTVIIKLRNDTAGSLSDAVQFNFNIHKGATS